MKPERRLPITPITLEVVRDLSQLEHVQAEWNRFAASVPGATPFQLPAWQALWWRHYGEGRMHTMLFRSMDDLIAVLPFAVSQEQMELAGTGMAPVLEPPMVAARAAEVLNLLKGHLAGNPAWTRCSWRHLQAGSPLLGLQLGDKFQTTTQPEAETHSLAIQGPFQAFWETRSFALRRNFLRYLDRSRSDDRPRFEFMLQADPEFVNAAIRLSGDAFAGAREGHAAFLSDLAKTLDKTDTLRFFGLRLQNRIVAVLLTIAYRGELFSFVGGADPAFEAQGFHRVLLFECLRHAFEQGFRAWHFSAGQETDAVLWGAQPRAAAGMTIDRKS